MDEGYIKEIKEVQVLGKQNLTKPIEKVKLEISHFTKEEMICLLSRVPPNKKGIMFQFLWRTGVRVTELISVEKQHLDFDNSEITIRWLKKRKVLYRIIPMHHSLKTPLFMFTSKLKYDEKLFPITRQRVDQLCKQYGFGHAHKIRHSFAVNFLRQSESPMSLIILKEILGHNQIETTMKYLKVVPMDMKKAMENISFD